jgi:hypothetical protein
METSIPTLEEKAKELLNFQNVLTKLRSLITDKKPEQNLEQDIEKCEKQRVLEIKESEFLRLQCEFCNLLYALSEKDADKLLITLFKQSAPLGTRIKKRFNYLVEFQNSFKSEVRKVYAVKPEDTIEAMVKWEGATIGYYVWIREMKLYLKECLSYKQTKKINPKELFVYKLLEHTKLGPKANFLFRESAEGKPGCDADERFCFISTIDLRYSKVKKEKLFAADHLIDSVKQTNDVLIWKEALNNEQFKEEFMAFNILSDLFTIKDTYRANSDNYGCVATKDVTGMKYKLKVIDHYIDNKPLPLDYTKLDDCLLSLKDKLKENNGRQMRRAMPLISINMIEKDNIEFSKITIKNTCKRILEGKKNNDGTSVYTATARAKTDIERLMAQYPKSFQEDSKLKLDTWCEKSLKHADQLRILLEASE